MSRKLPSGKQHGQELCRVRLDRILFGASLKNGGLPHLDNYEIERDQFVRPQGKLPAYRRVRNLKNCKTGAIVGIQYECVRPWLPKVKGTVTAGEQHELSFSEVREVFAAFQQSRLLQCELAFDFRPGSGVDRAFVRAHGRFGKLRPIRNNPFPTLIYGTRKSSFFVRAYSKAELSCYRVEIQLQSSWLRQRSFYQPKYICRAAEQILASLFVLAQPEMER
jgi:hypothetical protein